MLEAHALLRCIDQLVVAIGQLDALDVQLEALRDAAAALILMHLRERRLRLRIVVQEERCGLSELRFDLAHKQQV